MTSSFNTLVETALQSIRRSHSQEPRIGIVLGSGLSELAKSFGGDEIPFGEIAGYPPPGVSGHAGLLYISNKAVVSAGRFHYYEGHGLDTVVLPIALMAKLGVRELILTNAAGGVHYSYRPGDLVLISDHINLQGANPLAGPHLEGYGPRFPDMTEVYDSTLRARARAIDPALKEGVYAAFSGPCYETPAEIRFARAIGADLVGMSTVPEATLAKAMGVKVLGISVVTNFAAGIGSGVLDHKEVIEAGKAAEGRLSALLEGLVANGESVRGV